MTSFPATLATDSKSGRSAYVADQMESQSPFARDDAGVREKGVSEPNALTSGERPHPRCHCRLCVMCPSTAARSVWRRLVRLTTNPSRRGVICQPLVLLGESLRPCLTVMVAISRPALVNGKITAEPIYPNFALHGKFTAGLTVLRTYRLAPPPRKAEVGGRPALAYGQEGDLSSASGGQRRSKQIWQLRARTRG